MIFAYLLGVYAFLVYGHALYVAVMGYKRRRDTVGLSLVEKVNVYFLLMPVAYLWDAGMCALVCVATLRYPRAWREVLLTGMLRRFIATEEGWRLKFAVWVCGSLLNPYDERHCG